jgi:hypothetical protein
MSMDDAIVPTFYLYGEPRRAVEERFVHVEALVDRTRPSEWTIRPHAHAELNHIFYVSTGGGSVITDEGLVPFTAPCLLLVPAGAVHGFRWELESAGSVVTVATSYCRTSPVAIQALKACSMQSRPLIAKRSSEIAFSGPFLVCVRSLDGRRLAIAPQRMQDC